MIGVVPRLLAGVAAVALGGALGGALGDTLALGPLGTIVGACLGAGVLIVVDGVRAARLMAWLRRGASADAPQEQGRWGELASRIERALRQRDQALRAEQLRLSGFLSAIEASPNGVLLLDRGDRIGWCNATAADHLGLDPARDREQAVTNLVRAPAFVELLQSGQWQDAIAMPMPASEGMLMVLVRSYGDGQKLIVTQDVTERLRADAIRRDLVANVSHEIRSPLTVLAGFIETLQTLELNEAERQRMLLLMQQQAERMQALVADLLALAQLEGRPRPPTDTWVPLAPLMQRVAADATELSAGRHRIELVEGPALALAGSDAELHSAVANLASNAVRYTPDGGTVRLSWGLRANGMATIEVVDSGIGIAREHLPRLTERFYRVDNSRSRETGGTGLGLAIVKHVVQRHGGSLDIESTVGTGSTFRLLLPPARVQVVGQPAAASLAL